MSQSAITVRVKMDEKIYRRFSYFDAFRLRKRWRSPLLFSAIMLAFAVVCFVLQKQESVMIGSVLAAVGVGLPLVWFGSYISSVRLKAVQLKLEKPRPAYTVTVSDRLRVENDMKKEPAQEMSWDKVFGVWRGKNATYLYATSARAFILPDGQADAEPEILWETLTSCLGEEKMHGSVRKAGIAG